MLFLILQNIEDREQQEYLTAFYVKYFALLKKKSLDILNGCGIPDRFDLSDDLVQDAMIRMIRQLEKISKLSEPQLVAYGVKTVQSCTLDYCRKDALRRKAAFAQSVLDETQNDQVWQNCLEASEKESIFLRLGQVLESLPIRDRDVLIYKYFLEYDDEKIAGLLGIKTDSVRMTLTRARQRAKISWNLEKEKEGGV